MTSRQMGGGGGGGVTKKKMFSDGDGKGSSRYGRPYLHTFTPYHS